MSGIKTIAVRAFCTVGVLTTITVPLLIAARLNRSNGVLGIDDLENAVSVSLVTTIREFENLQALTISMAGHPVPDAVVKEVASKFGVDVGTTGRDEMLQPGRCTYSGNDSDAGTHFDAALDSTPLWRIWNVSVCSGPCHYIVTLAKIGSKWRAIRTSGGCRSPGLRAIPIDMSTVPPN